MQVDKTVKPTRRVQGERVRKSLQKDEPVCLSLATSSMSPALRLGDERIVEAAFWQRLRPGAIVLYECSEVRFALRLIRVGRNSPNVRLITKGDAAESYDSSVSIESYPGTLTGTVRTGHAINLKGLSARGQARPWVVRWV